jgi:hypothetical protein
MVCQSTIVGTVCLNAGEKEPRELNLSDVCARTWQPGRVYAAAIRVRPASRPSGFEYEATAGQSGFREPKWPAVLAATITDGSVTWTARAISNASLSRTITSAAWSAPAGITLSAESVVNTDGAQRITAYIQGDTAGTYAVTATVTFSDGSVEAYVLNVTVA